MPFIILSVRISLFALSHAYKFPLWSTTSPKGWTLISSLLSEFSFLSAFCKHETNFPVLVKFDTLCNVDIVFVINGNIKRCIQLVCITSPCKRESHLQVPLLFLQYVPALSWTLKVQTKNICKYNREITYLSCSGENFTNDFVSKDRIFSPKPPGMHIQ